MKITENKTDGLYSEFTIEVPAETIEKKINSRLKEVGKNVKIAGFRPGKAPMALLQQRYGESARAEALEKVVEETTSKALKEKNIKPALMPKVDVTKFGNDNVLEFTVMVEKLPAIEPADFAKITLEKPVLPVSDAEIDEALAKIAGNYKTSQPLTTQRPAKMGDTVRMNFDGSSNGKKLPGMKAKDFDLELGTNMFVDTFEEQLVGAKAGDKKTIAVQFPDDYRHPDLKGQPAEFEVEVLDVRESIAAALDDELAKKAGLKSLDELKAAIKSQLEKDYDSLSRARVKRALLDELDKANKFDVPQSMVDAEFDQIWKYHLQDVKARALDETQAADDGETKAEFKTIAERRVRLGLLLSEIGERNKVTVSNQEINQAVMREAYNYPGQEEQVVKFYKKNPQAVQSLRAPIFEEKVVDLILSQAKMTEKQVTREELTADPDEEMETARVEKTAKKKSAKK